MGNGARSSRCQPASHPASLSLAMSSRHWSKIRARSSSLSLIAARLGHKAIHRYPNFLRRFHNVSLFRGRNDGAGESISSPGWWRYGAFSSEMWSGVHGNGGVTDVVVVLRYLLYSGDVVLLPEYCFCTVLLLEDPFAVLHSLTCLCGHIRIKEVTDSLRLLFAYIFVLFVPQWRTLSHKTSIR